MKNPNILRLESATKCDVTANINGKWVPARPLGLVSFKNRCKAALLVFTGKADALIWPEGQ